MARIGNLFRFLARVAWVSLLGGLSLICVVLIAARIAFGFEVHAPRWHFRQGEKSKQVYHGIVYSRSPADHNFGVVLGQSLELSAGLYAISHDDDDLYFAYASMTHLRVGSQSWGGRVSYGEFDFGFRWAYEKRDGCSILVLPDLMEDSLGRSLTSEEEKRFWQDRFSSVDFCAPLWAAIPATAFLPLLVFVRGPLRRKRRRKRGLCEGCGYDLRGNVSGVCSECGKETTKTRKKKTLTLPSP